MARPKNVNGLNNTGINNADLDLLGSDDDLYKCWFEFHSRLGTNTTCFY